MKRNINTPPKTKKMKRVSAIGIKELIEVVQKRGVIRKIKGKKYLCAYPKRDKNRVPTAKEVHARERFKRWSAYAARAITDPVLKDAYALKIENKETAYNRALADASRPPKIVSVVTTGYTGRIGNSIFINAQDDFLVGKVCVSINKFKRLVEEGEAVQLNSFIWEYKAKVMIPKLNKVRIVVTAYDLPGNSASMEVQI
jgi:hypothetical protein